MEGIIIKNISNDYTVKTPKGLYTCKARGKFRKDNIVPLVGDYVVFDEIDKYILDIKKRKNSLIRPSVVNVDQALIVTSVKPSFDKVLLDKLLTIISFNNITPIICFTKLDLLEEEERPKIDKYIKYYKKIGYQVVTNENKNIFKNIFSDKITVLTGQSGAGKSTLINMLDKTLELKTNEISKALGRGKHTTRHVELFEIMNGFVVDTPGFSSIDFHDMKPSDIRDNMNEMFDNLQNCKYRDCMHINEDGCAVKQKVETEEILLSRYNNYKSFIKRS